MPVDINSLPPDGNPLTEKHLQELNDAMEKIKRGRKALELAGRAGWDTTAAKAAIDSAETQVRRIKETYFPGR